MDYQDSNYKNALLCSLYSILTYVLLFTVGLSQIILVTILKPFLGTDNYFNNALILFLDYFILFAILIGINFKSLKIEFKQFVKANNISLVLLGFLALYLVSFFVSLLVNNIEINYNFANFFFHKEIATTSQNQNSIVALINSKGMLLTFFSASIFGPVVEELIFRKSLFTIFKDDSKAFIISSVIFAMIHVVSSIGTFNLMSIILITIDYLAPAFVLGYIYIKGNKNVLYTILVHIIYNTFAMVLMFI